MEWLSGILFRGEEVRSEPDANNKYELFVLPYLLRLFISCALGQLYPFTSRYYYWMRRIAVGTFSCYRTQFFVPCKMATAAVLSGAALSLQRIVAMFSQEYCCFRQPNTEQIRLLLFVQRSKLVFCQLKCMLLLHSSHRHSYLRVLKSSMIMLLETISPVSLSAKTNYS
jgi:hypothetical protein